MKNFETRWQKAARHARKVPARGETIPPGFAARAIALARRTAEPAPALEKIWQRLCLGTLATVAAILAACFVSEWPHLADRQTLDPGIEDTVALVLDRL